jgi:hypothetical protein
MRIVRMVLVLLLCGLAIQCGGDDGEGGLSSACGGDDDCGAGLFCSKEGDFKGMCVATCDSDSVCEAKFGAAAQCVGWADLCSVKCSSSDDCPSGRCATLSQYCHTNGDY